MSAVTFPDATAIVIGRLRTALPSLTFHHEIPNPRPVTFVRIFRTGGPRANLVVDGAQITIESWAADIDVAMTNAQTVRGRLLAIHEQIISPAICRVDEFSGPAELPDPVSTSRRITWTVVVWVRGT